MLLYILNLVLLSSALEVSALISPRSSFRKLQTRQNDMDKLVLPMYDTDSTARAQQIQIKRENFIYGPSSIGSVPYFPTGMLGNATVQVDVAGYTSDANQVGAAIQKDVVKLETTLNSTGGINSIEDFKKLYVDQWKNSIPDGLDPGILTNSTQDLLFSMNRLSASPWAVKRLHPTNDDLPFTVDADTVSKLTGVELEFLHSSGRLFYVDHSYLSKYSKTDKYSAACSAYFYIHPSSDDFLPLAIKTNSGSDLIYTPLDSENDWTLAKMMFNSNDFFATANHHLASTHKVIDIVHEAAMRTLGDDHPIMAILNRLMFEEYGVQPAGWASLYAPGQQIDQYFPITGAGAAELTSNLYTSSSGLYQANYLLTNVKNRGLIDCDYGPPLKSFPYYEDASPILSAIQKFMQAFISSYYTSDSLVAQDTELQAWLEEANGPAIVLDFPATIITISDIVEVLTHFAFLGGVYHPALNTGTPAAASNYLPYNPAAFYQPLPTTKGVEDLLPFLPPVEACIAQISLFAYFNRPFYAAEERTLEDMFSDAGLLARADETTVDAAKALRSEMVGISGKIQGRGFDGEGLAQGMPFVYRRLDPGVIPFFAAV